MFAYYPEDTATTASSNCNATRLFRRTLPTIIIVSMKTSQQQQHICRSIITHRESTEANGRGARTSDKTPGKRGFNESPMVALMYLESIPKASYEQWMREKDRTLSCEACGILKRYGFAYEEAPQYRLHFRDASIVANCLRSLP